MLQTVTLKKNSYSIEDNRHSLYKTKIFIYINVIKVIGLFKKYTQNIYAIATKIYL